ncbi:DALR anticodon-binding domain-containing protein [Labrys okinawensis]|uniref:DALR anticodon-binding domain-containing protein n=1 Tax=Labrys okinawensis TaxID=346911 RepID=UPI0039BC88B3
MDFLADLEGHLREAAAALLAEGAISAKPKEIRVEQSREDGRGDFTSAIALASGNETGLERRLFAEAMAAKLRGNLDFAEIDVAGPGFLNLTIAPQAWGTMLATMLAEDRNYGRGQWGEGREADIGFLSVDEAVPLRSGHARGAVIGDALANMLDFRGFRASRSYRLNGGGVVTVRLEQSVRLDRGGNTSEANPSLAELKSAIGEDATRLGILMEQSSVPVTLDAALLTDLSHANPIFHMQYAHARCCAIRQKGDTALPGLTEPASWDPRAFADEGARLILRLLTLYPRKIDHAARRGEAHWLARYLYDLASVLHAQYYRSLTAPHLRFIRVDDRLLMGARLALVRGVEAVLKSGLALLGACAPDEIR